MCLTRRGAIASCPIVAGRGPGVGPCEVSVLLRNEKTYHGWYARRTRGGTSEHLEVSGDFKLLDKNWSGHDVVPGYQCK